MSNDDGRDAPLNLPGETFRALGHALVDQIAEFYDSLPERPVTRSNTPREIRAMLGDTGLPDSGTDPGKLFAEVAQLLFDYSLHNGHPRFLGYITSSGAPLGALGDLLAAAVNSNLGVWNLSPVASEIERQTIRWIAEFVGYPTAAAIWQTSSDSMQHAARRRLGIFEKPAPTRTGGR